MAKKRLPAWAEVVRPDPIVFSERLDESLFAADLYDVTRGKAAREYQDPQRFADRTYPTEGMVQLLSDVLKRLAGKGNVNPVIQIQTPFGGGKTHSLIALYHLAKNGAQLRYTPLGEQVAEKAGFPQFPPVKVAVFVGTVTDPLKSKTLWGIIAEQLGRYDLVEDNDQKRVAPGRTTMEQVIGQEPTLILIDEIAEFVARCPDDYQAQVLTFCQVLTETARSLPRCCVVVTLPSSTPYGERGEKALNNLQRIFGRMEAIYEPVRGMEIYEVVRCRLFNFPPGWQEDAYTVVDEYITTYRQWSDAPEWAQSEDYRERMLRAYPFHPLLIDWLYERWGSYPTFQRTRGVLRFLGLVVQEAWRQQESDPQKRPPLIQSAQVNLRRQELEGELVRHIGQEFRSVIQADIRERAPRIDSGMGDWQVYGVATGLATSIFLASFTAAEEGRKGASLAELQVAVWRPGLEPAVIAGALKSLERSLLYLHEREGLYLFSLEPNLTRLRLEYEERVSREEIQQELCKRLEELLQPKEHWTVRIADDPKSVPDTRELQMVVLPPDLPSAEAEKRARDILEWHGTTPRRWRNALVVVFADSQKLNTAISAVRTYLALQRIERGENYKRLSRRDQEELKKEREEAAKDALRHLCEAYRSIAKLTDKGIERIDMGAMGVGEKPNLVERVKETLKQRDLLMTERVNPEQVQQLLGDLKEKRADEIWHDFGCIPQLPMLLHKGVLAETLRRGVQQRQFAVRIGEQVYYGEKLPPSGDYWLSDATVLRELPEKIVEPPKPTITEEDIQEAVGNREEVAVREVYEELRKEKQQAFPSEAAFNEAFLAALRAGMERGQWQIVVGRSPFAGEAMDLATLLKRGTLRRVAPPPPPKPLQVRVKVPTTQIGTFVQTLVQLKRSGLIGDEVEVAFLTTPLDEGRHQQLRTILKETLQQVKGTLHEPKEWS